MNGNTITNFTVDSFSTIVGSNIAFADSFSTNGFSLFNTIPNFYFMTNVPDSGQVFRYVPSFAEGTQNTILFKNTKVYPTLVEQTVHIQTDLKDYQVYVVNMFGDVVFSSPRKEPSTMDLSGLPSGFYLLKVVSNKQETVFKIQKK
jgi:hypothetical protein